MIKFILIFMILFTSSVIAQVNDEAISNMEVQIGRFEELARTLTSQIEENNHNSKVRNLKIEATLKDIDLSIQNLKDEIAKHKERMVEIEISNEKVHDEIDMLENEISQIKDFIKTIPTKEPFSLVEDNVKSSPTIVSSKVEDELLLLNKEKDKQKEDSIDSIEEYDEYKQALSFYNDKSYTESAIRFAEFIKKYPAGKSFYPSLLYLGLSMKELGKVNNACQAFANIINSKEKVDEKIKKSANEEFGKLGCTNLNKKDGKQ